MNKEALLIWLDCLIESVSSDFCANVLSFLELVIAMAAFAIGGKKVSELIREYNNRRNRAIFSYHVNLKIYIKRIKKLTSDNTGAPLKTLYLLSPKKNLRDEGKGYENLSNELYSVAHNLLDFLSSKSDQIPAASDLNQINEWDNLIELLVDYLLDFTLFGSGSYLSSLKDYNSITNYHTNLIDTLKNIEKMIINIESKYIKDLENEQDSE